MPTAPASLGLKPLNSGVFDGTWRGRGAEFEALSPVDGKSMGRVRGASAVDYEAVVTRAQEAFGKWRSTPAPVRGETIRQLGNALREAKSDLGRLVTLESGKILAEGEGEVQEMIDICDFAVGLSRQLYGLTIASERANHRLMEQWHPLGVCGVISAFNFPVAVWSWNAALAAVCGNSSVWKPSEKTPLTAVAVTRIAEHVCKQTGADPAIFSLLSGSDIEVTGAALSRDHRVPLVSATGSCGMGRKVARVVAERLGRSLLELGGNNALIVTPSATLDLALRAIVFGAVGTAGQRCTSTRRVLVHSSIAKKLREQIVAAYKTVKIGNPLKKDTLMGPLIDKGSVERFLHAVDRVRAEGGKVLTGGERLKMPGGCYVTPCVADAQNDMAIVQEETFGPLLYLIEYDRLDQAIAMQNAVPQGLSSAIFTNDFREAEEFLCARGSDCGIANVNAGTSGAEIGGAFGGEKETGGGRESGSDSWKAYMRRQTNTINYGAAMPLAQGITFNVG